MDIRNKDDIRLIIDQFYHKVLQDNMLKDIFLIIAKIDLESHMPLIYDFWESIVLENHSYKGSPIQAHLDLNKKFNLSKKHFDKWLLLFNETIDDNYFGENALKMKNSAFSIAVVMQSKISNSML
ncbi:MAG: hemoglobin [Patiriisocius sp.]|jgi:hemoglobin